MERKCRNNNPWLPLLLVSLLLSGVFFSGALADHQQRSQRGGWGGSSPPTAGATMEAPPWLEVEDEEGRGGWRRKDEAAAPLGCHAGFATADHDPPDDGSNGKGANGKHGNDTGGDGECHCHSHGHHGCDGDHDGKRGKQGTPPTPAGSNPWVVSPGPPRPPGASAASGFTASAAAGVLVGAAVVGCLLPA